MKQRGRRLRLLLAVLFVAGLTLVSLLLLRPKLEYVRTEIAERQEPAYVYRLSNNTPLGFNVTGITPRTPFFVFKHSGPPDVYFLDVCAIGLENYEIPPGHSIEFRVPVGMRRGNLVGVPFQAKMVGYLPNLLQKGCTFVSAERRTGMDFGIAWAPLPGSPQGAD